VRRCQLCWGRVRLPHVAARSRGVRVVFFFQLQKGKCCQKFTILFLWVIHTQSICKFLIAFSFLRMQKEGHVRPPPRTGSAVWQAYAWQRRVPVVWAPPFLSPNKTSLTYNHFWSCGGRLGPPPFQKSRGHPRKAQDTPRKPRKTQDRSGKPRTAQESPGSGGGGAGGYGEGWGGDFPINWKPFFFVAPDTNLKREFFIFKPSVGGWWIGWVWGGEVG
jgi:hypothetical protein